MAPNHAATLVGITSFVANCVSLMAPLAVGFVIKDEVSMNLEREFLKLYTIKICFPKTHKKYYFQQ